MKPDETGGKENYPEIREVLTPAERAFERGRQTVGLFLGPVVMLVLWLYPSPGLGVEAQRLAAVLGLVVVYWVTEPIPIPVTALLGAMLCVVLGVAKADEVFEHFAKPTIFLFMGSFMIAEAMKVHGVNRRFAFGILRLPWVGESTARILFAFGFICVFLSMWISNTATTAMMFPVGLGLVQVMADVLSERTGRRVEPHHLRFGTAIMLMTAYASSAGGIGTPVGTPPNLIGLAMIESQVKVKIPFFQWMLLAVPILAVMCVFLFGLLWFTNRPELSRIDGCREYVRREVGKLGRWTRGQVNTLFAFLVTVVLWTIPGVLSVAWGTESSVYRDYAGRIPESVAALVGAVLLFVLPVNWRKREFTLSWSQAVRIDWGTLILFGGGISLGNLMFKTGLAEVVGESLLELGGLHSVWGITLAAIAISVVVSEASSNTAAANMVVPVTISLAIAAGADPIPPAIGATLGASWGFMLPVATPPNAIVYGSGLIPITKMIRAGFLFDLGGILIIWAGLRILLPILGLT